MFFADISASAALTSTLFVLACCVTIIGFLVALVLSFRRQTRGTALRIFRLAVYSVALDVGLLLLVLALDRYA